MAHGDYHGHEACKERFLNERRMRFFALAGVLALLGFNVAYKSRPERKEIDEASQDIVARAQWIGRLAPNFELSLMDGKTVSLADLVGKKIVILNFWATWCAPCRAEMPELNRYVKANSSRPIDLIGIDAAETPETVAAFLRGHPVSFPVGIDGNRAIQAAYEVKSYPTTVVIGADGRVLLYETNAIQNAEVSLDAVVRPGLDGLKGGRTVTKEAYLEKLKTEPAPRRRGSAKTAEERLEGRAKRIADVMPCPCGCSDRVAGCGCQTSRKIKEKLRADRFGDKTDTAIMEELNKEFCMKGMGS